MMDDVTPRNRPSHDGQVVNAGSIKTGRGGNHELDSGEYAVLVSCHCSHTGNTMEKKLLVHWIFKISFC